MSKQTVKVDSEIVKARNRARSFFRRERKLYEERELEDARIALQRSRNRCVENRTTETISQSLVSWVSRMATPVLASLDITPEMKVSVQEYGFRSEEQLAKAYTDFQSIVVQINEKAYNDLNTERVSRLIAMTKGLIYHEAGHILYTIPFRDLYETGKAQGFAFTQEPDEATLDIASYQYCWNLLEDQRMECAVVRTSPIIERYLQVVVLDVVLRSLDPNAKHMAWQFVSGRTYLPKAVLDVFRRDAVAHAQQSDLVEVLNEIDDTIRQYKRATTEVEMLVQVNRLRPLLRMWTGDSPHRGGTGNPDEHGTINRINRDNPPNPGSSSTDSPEWEKPTKPENPGKSGKQSDKNEDKSDTPEQSHGGQSDPTPVSQDETDESDTDDDVTGQPDDQSDEGETVDANDQDGGIDDDLDDDNSEESDNNDPGKGVGAGDNPDSKPSDDQKGLQDAINDIIRDVVTPDTVNDLMSSVNDAVRRGIPYDPTIRQMPAHLVAQSEIVRDGMLNALEPLAVQADPAWRFRQESGVLDPVAFRLRDPGDTDYWSSLDDTGMTGHDLAVSVILDVSFSMGDYTDALSVSAMGIRMACDDLDIPCTLSTFTESGYIMLDATDQTTPILVNAHGGTEPIDTLEDLPNQRCDKGRHLVVVLTDGEWNRTTPPFSHYRTQGMYILGVGFGYGVAEALEKRGPDACIEIESVTQLPEQVTKALTGYLI